VTDAEFARAFEQGQVPNADFHHAAHLRLAWVYLRESGSVEQAANRMAAALRRFATAAGKPDKYHHTMTMFWVEALARAAGAAMPGATADEVLRAHPYLLDKELPLAFYSPDRLFSSAARLSCVAPDREPVTRDAASPHPAHPSSDAPHRPVSGRAAR